MLNKIEILLKVCFQIIKNKIELNNWQTMGKNK